ncbi:hypothetical protein [Piscinibacter sakaiensis]|uniref:hypothetical protein n=1 Tax=Piscinibacter sakaiensis TaxID=1547922 RepID=UPI003AAB9517
MTRTDAIPPLMTAVHLLGHGGFEMLQVRDDVPIRPRAVRRSGGAAALPQPAAR